MTQTPAQIAAEKALKATRDAIAAKTGQSSSGKAADFGSTNNLDSWSKTVSGAQFNTSNFPILGLSSLGPKATGDQILQALSRMVYQDPGNWQQIRSKIVALGGKTLTKAQLTKPWTGTDQSAIEDWLTQIHRNNVDLSGVKAYTPPDLYSAFTIGSKQITTLGAGGANVKPSSLVSVHSSADLASAAQGAFQQTLGRLATPQEAQAFTKAFQTVENNYGQAKNDAKKSSVFNAPAQTIDFSQTGQPAVPAQNNVSTDQGAIQAPPTPSIAAANFAAKTNPNEASAQALSDALGNIIKNIGG